MRTRTVSPTRTERPRGARTKSAWLLAVPFLVLARPTPEALVLGAALAAGGLALRGWAAGTIRKDEALTTAGPYAFVRHPLYAGSLLIGIGLGTAGGHWVWPVLVVAFFAAVYSRTVTDEAVRLTALFGHAYVEYAAHVPGLIPRLTPYRSARGAGDFPAGSAGFRWSQYMRHREWEASLGAVAGLAVLAVKMRWLG